MRQPSDATRTLRAFSGMLVLAGMVLVFFAPALALIAFCAAGMVALYLWLLGKRIEQVDAEWAARQAQRQGLVDRLEADGTITHAEGEAQRASDGGLRHPSAPTESVEAVNELGNRHQWIAGALLTFVGFGLILVSTPLGVTVMGGGLAVMLWSIFGDRETRATMRRQVERTRPTTADPIGHWDAVAAELRTLRRAHDAGQVPAAVYESRHRRLLDRLG